MADTNLYDEWASGVSIANVPPDANSFFEEIPTELNKPSEFRVSPEQIPSNPVASLPETQTQGPEVPAQVQEPEANSEVLSLPNGGTITVEKTSKGWKATLDSKESGINPENFYGNNKTQLIAELAKGKLEASKLIRKLKREKLLGGDEPVAPTTPPITSTPLPASNPLSADDVYAIKSKLVEADPEAFDLWMQKRFGINPDRFAEALKAAEHAKEIVDSQRIKSEVDEVNAEFISNNQDWAEDYSSDPENIRKLVARMAKAHLNRRLKLNSPQATVDTTIYELFSNGYWTAENLEKAKEELIEVGELHKLSVDPVISKPEPQPVAETKGPSVPEQPRIATPNGQKAVPVSFGTSAKQSVSTTPVEDKTLSDVDLQNMPLSELKAIAAAQLRAQQQGRQ